MAIEIDPEFRALIPPLSADERAQLESNLLAEGCRNPLVVWNGVLLDGHHRFDICTAHQIPYQTVEVECLDRDAAKIWIIRNQFGRRNLNTFQRAELVLALEPLLAAQAKVRQQSGLKQGSELPSSSSEDNGGKTHEKLAEVAGLSRMAMTRALAVKKRGSPGLQAQVRDGRVSLSHASQEVWAGRCGPIVAPTEPRPRSPRRTPLRKESDVIDAVNALLEEFRRRRLANNDDLNARKWIPNGINVKRQIDIANWLDGELVSLIERWRALSPSTDPRRGDDTNVH